MPQVVHSFRGENRLPRLKVPKGERAILENAGGLCRAIANAVAGYNPELHDQTEKLADELLKLAQVEEMQLEKPF